MPTEPPTGPPADPDHSWGVMLCDARTGKRRTYVRGLPFFAAQAHCELLEAQLPAGEGQAYAVGAGLPVLTEPVHL